LDNLQMEVLMVDSCYYITRNTKSMKPFLYNVLSL